MNDLKAFILANAESSEMGSKYSKFSKRLLGKPLIGWTYDALKGAGIDEYIAILGQNNNQITEYLGESVKYVITDKQLQIDHVYAQIKQHFHGTEGNILLISGDIPLISSKTILEALEHHKVNKNCATVIKGEVALSDKETEFSVFILKAERMSEAIDDAIENGSNKILSLKEIQAFTERKSLKVGIFKVIDTNEIKCVSNGIQFSQAAKILRKQILYHFMNSGVTIIDPETTYIDAGVEIGRDTVIYPGTIIEGRTVIGEDCIIGPNSRLVSSYIGNEVEIANSIVKESSIDDKTNIGPFAYLRPESKIGKQVKIGDFVEIKKSTIGDCTKISHLTYVGDAEIGSNVNLGCGVVVVNYDGKNKNKTIVEDNAFIGCNVNLVAPVTVRSNAFVAAGSTITEEVPRDSLAIARSRQILKEDWVNNRKDK